MTRCNFEWAYDVVVTVVAIAQNSDSHICEAIRLKFYVLSWNRKYLCSYIYT